MDVLKGFADLFLHLDQHLGAVIQQYGAATYALLFLIIFCETGLVILPLLPGDSLLFAAGAFAEIGDLNPHFLFLLLSVAAILGDTVNYWIGAKVGPKIFARKDVRFLNVKHLERAHQFYEKYGAKTIVIARFVPIIRTFAPFVAGIGRMTYGRFIAYNVAGGLLWVAICVYAGYFFGNLAFVKDHFTLVILAIIAISLMPPLIEFFRHRNADASPTSNA